MEIHAIVSLIVFMLWTLLLVSSTLFFIILVMLQEKVLLRVLSANYVLAFVASWCGWVVAAAWCLGRNFFNSNAAALVCLVDFLGAVGLCASMLRKSLLLLKFDVLTLPTIRKFDSRAAAQSQVPSWQRKSLAAVEPNFLIRQKERWVSRVTWILLGIYATFTALLTAGLVSFIPVVPTSAMVFLPFELIFAVSIIYSPILVWYLIRNRRNGFDSRREVLVCLVTVVGCGILYFIWCYGLGNRLLQCFPAVYFYLILNFIEHVLVIVIPINKIYTFSRLTLGYDLATFTRVLLTTELFDSFKVAALNDLCVENVLFVEQYWALMYRTVGLSVQKATVPLSSLKETSGEVKEVVLGAAGMDKCPPSLKLKGHHAPGYFDIITGTSNGSLPQVAASSTPVAAPSKPFSPSTEPLPPQETLTDDTAPSLTPNQLADYMRFWETFIRSGASMQINLPYKQVESMTRQIHSKTPISPFVFEPAYVEVVKMLYYNVFPKWIKSRKESAVDTPSSTATATATATAAAAAVVVVGV